MHDDDRKIIFFDGVCNLCNRTVQTILKHDGKKQFYFSSLQSQFSAYFFTAHQYHPGDSVIYWDGKKFYEESAAILRIASRMNFPYPLLAAGFILPPFLRDGIYQWISKHRYKWFGKRDTCMLPDPSVQNRFLG